MSRERQGGPQGEGHEQKSAESPVRPLRETLRKAKGTSIAEGARPSWSKKGRWLKTGILASVIAGAGMEYGGRTGNKPSDLWPSGEKPPGAAGEAGAGVEESKVAAYVERAWGSVKDWTKATTSDLEAAGVPVEVAGKVLEVGKQRAADLVGSVGDLVRPTAIEPTGASGAAGEGRAPEAGAGTPPPSGKKPEGAGKGGKKVEKPKTPERAEAGTAPSAATEPAAPAETAPAPEAESAVENKRIETVIAANIKKADELWAGLGRDGIKTTDYDREMAEACRLYRNALQEGKKLSADYEGSAKKAIEHATEFMPYCSK